MTPLIQTYPLLQMASGDALKVQMYRFQGTQSGPMVYIQANLHGAEVVGNAVIQQLMTYLQGCDPAVLRGEIRLVPVCNPLGINLRSHHFASGRYNPYDGRDWNRIFWDFSQQGEDILAFALAHQHLAPEVITQRYRQRLLACFQQELDRLDRGAGAPVHERYRSRLQALALEANIVIDLHSSSDRGLVYAYYFRDREDWAATFGFDFALLSDRDDGDAFDEAFIKPWLALESAMVALGRPLRFDVAAWTLELGNAMDLQPTAVQRGLSGVLNYLRHRGILSDRAPVQTDSIRYTRTSCLTKYHATTGGFVQERVEPGTWVQPGDRLYDLLCFNKTGALPEVRTVSAATAGLVYDVALNAAVNEGEYVLATLAPTDPPAPLYFRQ